MVPSRLSSWGRATRSGIELRTLLVCTIGHSNRSIGTFVELLRANEIVRVLDVRTVPRSRHNPQFNRETLADSVQGAGLAYRFMGDTLGGKPADGPTCQMKLVRKK